jgi:hypothetical protein
MRKIFLILILRLFYNNSFRESVVSVNGLYTYFNIQNFNNSAINERGILNWGYFIHQTISCDSFYYYTYLDTYDFKWDYVSRSLNFLQDPWQYWWRWLQWIAKIQTKDYDYFIARNDATFPGRSLFIYDKTLNVFYQKTNLWAYPWWIWSFYIKNGIPIFKIHHYRENKYKYYTFDLATKTINEITPDELSSVDRDYIGLEDWNIYACETNNCSFLDKTNSTLKNVTFNISENILSSSSQVLSLPISRKLFWYENVIYSDNGTIGISFVDTTNHISSFYEYKNSRYNLIPNILPFAYNYQNHKLFYVNNYWNLNWNIPYSFSTFGPNIIWKYNVWWLWTINAKYYQKEWSLSIFSDKDTSIASWDLNNKYDIDILFQKQTTNNLSNSYTLTLTKEDILNIVNKNYTAWWAKIFKEISDSLSLLDFTTKMKWFVLKIKDFFVINSWL